MDSVIYPLNKCVQVARDSSNYTQENYVEFNQWNVWNRFLLRIQIDPSDGIREQTHHTDYEYILLSCYWLLDWINISIWATAKNGERKMGNRKQDEIILFYFQIHLHLWKVLIHSLCGNRATFSSCHNACDPRWVPLRNNTAIRVTSRHSWRHTEQIVDHYSNSPCDKPSYHSNVCL